MADRTVNAVDAADLARLFTYALAGLVASALLAGVVALADVVAFEAVVAAFTVLAGTLIAGLAVGLRRLARRRGHRIDLEQAISVVPVQDASAWGIAAAALGSAGVVGLRFGFGTDPLSTALIAGLAGVAVIALSRLGRVQLAVLDDALVRVPPYGIGNRYPWDAIETLAATAWTLKVRTRHPLAEWTTITSRAEEIADVIQDKRVEEE